ncbi:MAG TPA: hypothetical protein VF740_13885 [Candidatus Acidoferrum sp.]
MKRAILVALLSVGFLGVTWGAYRTATPGELELSHFVPPGALLYLQAKDFASLLADWDKSQEKENWLKSKNYDVFSQSRLLLRLQNASNEFSKAAGVPVGGDLLHQVAGKQSVLALYDIGKLQFLYITRLASTDSMQSALWQTRSQFETRTAGGVNFFYRLDTESDREVAFAVTGDHLLLATHEDLMAGALQLLAGDKAQSVEVEPWWTRSVAAGGAPGDLRMVLNLEKIVPSPYFRSYWIQKNITDMKQYSAAVSDLTRSRKEYDEERVLLRKDAGHEAPESKGPTAVAEILSLVPANTGIYEAKADPDGKECLELLTLKLLAPHLGPAAPDKLAPQVQLGGGETGSASDLETRIDQPPTQNSLKGDTSAPLQAVFAKNHVLAQLQLQNTERDSAGVFVRIHSAVAFRGEADWDEQAVHAALVEFVRPGLTTGQMGVGWKTASGYSVLNGLWPLAVAVRGKYLIVSDNAAFLASALEGANKKPSASAAVFAAAFDHELERENFVTFTKMLDLGSGAPQSGGRPEFFSENMASLSFTLRGVSSEKIVIHDAADRQTQTVVYAWAQ